MEDNEQIIISDCPECGNTIRVKKTAVSIYCMVCQSWLKLNNEKLEKTDGNDGGGNKAPQ